MNDKLINEFNSQKWSIISGDIFEGGFKNVNIDYMKKYLNMSEEQQLEILIEKINLTRDYSCKKFCKNIFWMSNFQFLDEFKTVFSKEIKITDENIHRIKSINKRVNKEFLCKTVKVTKTKVFNAIKSNKILAATYLKGYAFDILIDGIKFEVRPNRYNNYSNGFTTYSSTLGETLEFTPFNFKNVKEFQKIAA